MKKTLSLIFLVALFSACGEDISVNNSAVFQGYLNNGFWQGGNAKATIDIGDVMVIDAVTLTETMALRLPIPPLTIDPKNKNTFIKYILGTSNTKKALYTLAGVDMIYEYETAIGVGDGEIVISQYDGNTISGTFRFNAFNTDLESEGEPNVNLQNGVLYRIPVSVAVTE